MSSLELSPDEFHAIANRVLDVASAYLERLDSLPSFPQISGAEAERLFRTPLPEHGIGADVLHDLAAVMNNLRTQNGRFFGYVMGSAEPVAAAADLLVSVLNQNVTAWRSSPAAATIERTVVGWLAEAVGCAGFSGSLTAGGSPANLMALAMARERALPANEDGLLGKNQGTFYASQEVHMSIPKSVALLGVGRAALRLIKVDEAWRMIPEELERAIVADREAGRTPIAIVATAGTVSTGAIDPLERIADIAQRYGVWMHVDGAYGALAAMARPEKFIGLNRADSLSLDPHKWLYQPVDCGCLLYRNAGAARTAFSHTGDYARTLTEDPVEGFAFFEESLELSRRFRALKLWMSLRYHGLSAFREAIAHDLSMAERLVEKITIEPTLEVMGTGELSAVCFRHRGAGEPDAFNASLLKRILQRGRVYLSNATLRGSFCLRACVVNHRTKPEDINAIVSETLAAAKELAGTP